MRVREHHGSCSAREATLLLDEDTGRVTLSEGTCEVQALPRYHGPAGAC